MNSLIILPNNRRVCPFKGNPAVIAVRLFFTFLNIYHLIYLGTFIIIYW